MEKAVNIVVYKQDKILILKRSPNETHYQNLWDLPGGGVESNENLKAAAEREAKEESGLEVKMEDDYFFIFSYDPTPEGEVFGFRAEVTGGEVLLSDEHTEFRWISKKNCNEFKYTPSVAATIKQFFKMRR